MDGFLGVLYSVVVFLGYAVPLLLVGIVAWLVWRRTRPGQGRPDLPPEPAT